MKEKLKVVETITWKMIMDKTKELTDMINNFSESKSDAAAFVCVEVINWSSYNYFEALGILEHSADIYKETVKEIEEEENNKQRKGD